MNGIAHLIELCEHGVRCNQCGQTWTRVPTRPNCPGVPVYSWEKAPAHLKTRRQLSELGLIPGQPRPDGCLPSSPESRRMGYEWVWLYDQRQARPKPELLPLLAPAAAVVTRQAPAAVAVSEPTPAPRPALAPAPFPEPKLAPPPAPTPAPTTASTPASRVGSLSCVTGEYLQRFHTYIRRQNAAWALELITDPKASWRVLAVETTGVNGAAEILQIAVLSPGGRILLSSLVRPAGPIPPEASAFHGITDAQVREAPRFVELHARLERLIAGRTVISYGADFAIRALAQTCERYGLPLIRPRRWSCAMDRYAGWLGEWSERYEAFRWQPLPQGDRTATGDCRATLALLHQMAGDDSSTTVRIVDDRTEAEN